jgi:hypothetical protein
MLRYAQSAGHVALAGNAHRHKADGCFEQLARTWAEAMAGSSSTDAPRRLSKMSTSRLVMAHTAVMMIKSIQTASSYCVRPNTFYCVPQPHPLLACVRVHR